jgi:nucleotide-binding universal stress UspA family protein
MSKPILVGFDPRTSDRAPVEFGVVLAGVTGAPLIIAAVDAGPAIIALSAGQTLPYAIAQMDDDLVGDCSTAVKELRDELAARGIPAECRTVPGTSAARALHEAAEQEDAGLLVVGSSRRGPVGRVLPGSTAERLLHGAPCPIAVAPRGWTARDDLETIGVAYVKGDEGRDALRGAHALARRAGATLRVITVVKVGLGLYSEVEPRFVAGQIGKTLEDVEGEHLAEARQAARSAVADLGDAVPVEVEALVGDPAETLVDVSQHLDVLVCGSRGYGPARAVLLGSVSRRVASEAHCPVIVLPRGVKASLEAIAGEAPGAAAPA